MKTEQLFPVVHCASLASFSPSSSHFIPKTRVVCIITCGLCRLEAAMNNNEAVCIYIGQTSLVPSTGAILVLYSYTSLFSLDHQLNWLKIVLLEEHILHFSSTWCLCSLASIFYRPASTASRRGRASTHPHLSFNNNQHNHIHTMHSFRSLMLNWDGSLATNSLGCVLARDCNFYIYCKFELWMNGTLFGWFNVMKGHLR